MKILSYLFVSIVVILNLPFLTRAQGGGRPIMMGPPNPRSTATHVPLSQAKPSIYINSSNLQKPSASLLSITSCRYGERAFLTDVRFICTYFENGITKEIVVNQKINQGWSQEFLNGAETNFIFERLKFHYNYGDIKNLKIDPKTGVLAFPGPAYNPKAFRFLDDGRPEEALIKIIFLKDVMSQIKKGEVRTPDGAPLPANFFTFKTAVNGIGLSGLFGVVEGSPIIEFPEANRQLYSIFFGARHPFIFKQKGVPSVVFGPTGLGVSPELLNPDAPLGGRGARTPAGIPPGMSFPPGMQAPGVQSGQNVPISEWLRARGAAWAIHSDFVTFKWGGAPMIYGPFAYEGGFGYILNSIGGFLRPGPGSDIVVIFKDINGDQHVDTAEFHHTALDGSLSPQTLTYAQFLNHWYAMGAIKNMNPQKGSVNWNNDPPMVITHCEPYPMHPQTQQRYYKCYYVNQQSGKEAVVDVTSVYRDAQGTMFGGVPTLDNANVAKYNSGTTPFVLFYHPAGAKGHNIIAEPKTYITPTDNPPK